MNKSVLTRLKNITTFVFDVDGVLTDGSLLVMDDGQMVRRMNVKDGYALQLAVKKGYRIAIISGGDSPAVQHRLAKLGITDVFMQVRDKKQQLHQYMQQHTLEKENILFMGDDMPDYEIMFEVGIATAPSDAVGEIKKLAAYISPVAGGYGCVRDVIEKVMKIRGDWTADTSVQSK